MTDRPFTTLRLDGRALRVLAHPLRSRLLSALRMDGPATATALARALDTNTGATSYHLRKLAAVGLVEETDEGRGRERWWRPSTPSHDWTERDLAGDSETEAASDWLKRYYLRSFVERYERWLATAAAWPLDWRAAAELGDTKLHVTPAQLTDFHDELTRLLDRYRDAAATDDPEARDVELFYHLVPMDR